MGETAKRGEHKALSSLQRREYFPGTLYFTLATIHLPIYERFVLKKLG